MGTDDLRINERIQSNEVRLIDDKGDQRGVLKFREALDLARESGLDLVEVAPNAKPPVCKLLDYSKYKFEQEKKSREQKKRQKQVKLKEVRMQPKIEKHDLDFKTKKIVQFLSAGNKVKVTIRFRGRELAHTEFGRVVLDKVLDILVEGTFTLETRPHMEGRLMSMILAPKGHH